MFPLLPTTVPTSHSAKDDPNALPYLHVSLSIVVGTGPARRCPTSVSPFSQTESKFTFLVQGRHRGGQTDRHVHTGRQAGFGKNSWGSLESMRWEIEVRNCTGPTSGEDLGKGIQRLGCVFKVNSRWLPCQETLVKIQAAFCICFRVPGWSSLTIHHCAGTGHRMAQISPKSYT